MKEESTRPTSKSMVEVATLVISTTQKMLMLPIVKKQKKFLENLHGQTTAPTFERM